MKTIRPLLTAMLFLGLAVPGSTDLVTMPENFSSVRAYPNPWKSNMHGVVPVTFDRLPASAMTTVRIFTIAGEHVRSLSGTQSIQWDLRNDSGQNVASGIYLYLLDANGDRKSGKLAVIR